MKKIILVIVILSLISFIGWESFLHYKYSTKITCTECGPGSDPWSEVLHPEVITSFDTCLKANHPIMESYPRQCKTQDGRTFTEKISEKMTYTNASSSMIVLTFPLPGAVTGKQFLVTGKARGGWYFEASFPIVILSQDGKIVSSSPAQAQSNWMTNEFVPFNATMTISTSYQGKATIVLKKDNPSGLPEKDASISFPIIIAY